MRLPKKIILGLLAAGVVAGVTTIPGGDAYATVQTVRSSVKGEDGKDYWVENNIDQAAADKAKGTRPEYLVVWAGDENIGDTVVPDVKKLPGSLANPTDKVRNAAPGPDFMAVVDVTKGSPSYGKVVNTATVGPLVENEPHHMQYSWRKGDKIYAGGLYSAATYVFDVSALPELKLSGISLPSQTTCGSVPDAYWVLKDGTAYGTYMGGPVVPGPCTYSNGEVRTGNGFAGTPGEVVRFGPDAQKLVEAPAATAKADDPTQCLNMPALGQPSCANPHGIQVREDLKTMVTSDYAEPRSIILDPVKAPSPYLRRPTVRTWDVSDLNHPKVKSVSYLPTGPRSTGTDPLYNENRAAMETTVTNLPGHKGAFAQTMQGGAIFYTPDITVPTPKWKEVYDLANAVKALDPKAGDTGGPSANGGWLQTSPDDKTLYHTIIGRRPGALGKDDPGTSGGVIALDISKLVESGADAQCSIDARDEIAGGGDEADCPTLKGDQAINPGTAAGGPHWGALDNLTLGGDGFYHETDQPQRLATTNYFVARTGIDGDHKVCLVDIEQDGSLKLDADFKDENTGQTCVSFNRERWPHGAFGNAKPHSMLFVTNDADIK